MASFLTKTARKKLARQAATQVHGTASNYQVGQAGKIIDKLVNDNPKQFINFDDVRYCTPKHEVIIAAAVEELITAAA